MKELWYDNNGVYGTGVGNVAVKVQLDAAGSISSASSLSKKPNIALIAGLSAAGLVVLVSAGLGLTYFLRKTHKYTPLGKSN